MVKFGQKVAL